MRLKTLRKARGMSQEALAERAGISRTYLARLETARQDPTLSTLEKLAKGYGGERGVRAFGAIDEALVALDRNAGVKIVADWLVLQL